MQLSQHLPLIIVAVTLGVAILMVQRQIGAVSEQVNAMSLAIQQSKAASTTAPPPATSAPSQPKSSSDVPPARPLKSALKKSADPPLAVADA